jgi:ribosomal-protein-alanine N-acetyltransferase
MIWGSSKNKVPENTPAFSDIRIETQRLLLRPPMLGDWQKWAQVREDNRDFLTPYEPEWPEKCLDKSFFQRRLAKQAKDWDEDRCYSFLIFKADDGALIGGVNINNVVRGAAYFASIGYWLDRDVQGQGYMSEALAGIITFSFDTLRLHRINAACITDNQRSANVLKRLGFTKEGQAEKYLNIGGAWKDHTLFGLCAEHWPDCLNAAE